MGAVWCHMPSRGLQANLADRITLTGELPEGLRSLRRSRTRHDPVGFWLA